MAPTMQTILQLMAENRLEDARSNILELLKTDPIAVRQNNIVLSHLLTLCAGWATISALIPQGCNGLASSGWLNSLLNGKPVDAKGNPVPWFTYPAIDFLDRLNAKAFDVFEWGAGQSTLWWAKRVRSVRAVDHDAGWYQKVRSGLPENARVELQVEMAGYVSAIGSDDATFDVVVVDGKHRNECIDAAILRCKTEGLIVLDNSDRRAYGAGIERLMQAGYRRIDFFGLLPSYLYRSCTSVFFKDDRYVRDARLPYEASETLGLTCAQVMNE